MNATWGCPLRLFIAVAIVGRIFLHVRRTGDSGIRSDTWKAAGGYELAGPLLGIGLLANFALCGLESINVLRPQMAPFAWTGVAVGQSGTFVHADPGRETQRELRS